MAHTDPLSFARLQPSFGQSSQPRLLLGQLGRSAGVPPGHQRSHELLVLLTIGKVPTATQQQLLLQCLLESPMSLFTVAVLVPAVRVRRLGYHAVVSHQRLIPRRVHLRVPIVVNGQRHSVGPMTLGHASQFPQGVLHPGAEAGETLGKAQAHVLPVRVRQHEVIQQVPKRLTLDGDLQLLHVREVRRTQPTWFMHLAEKYFLGWTVLALPLPHPPLHRAPMPLPVLGRVFSLQPVHQSPGLERRLSLQQFFQPWPHVNKRIGPGPPGASGADFTGQSPQVPILSCGLAIHTCFHRRVLQRCPPIQVAAYFLHLFVGYLAPCSHVATPFVGKLPG